MKARNKHLTIVGHYHPPHSSKNPPNSIFIDEIIDLLIEILPANNNHIILGEFNIHINDNRDVDAQIISESMDALGLEQHSITSTHKSDNILDLIFTEILSNIGVEVVGNCNLHFRSLSSYCYLKYQERTSETSTESYLQGS